MIRILLASLILTSSIIHPGSMLWEPATVSAVDLPSKQTLQKQVNQIQTYIRVSNWEQAEKLASRMEKTFHENEWQLQLLGDEVEIEGLQTSINRLKAAIKEKDSVQSNVEIAEIKTYIRNIYEL
ncbi:MAG: DUF4363 family protein [Bacillaceae bacterium]|nr:DUF4363 family protein [Bacillaceae bacterium]